MPEIYTEPFSQNGDIAASQPAGSADLSQGMHSKASEAASQSAAYGAKCPSPAHVSNANRVSPQQIPQVNPNADGYSGNPILSIRSVEKVFGSRDSVTRALNGISLDVMPGEFLSIMGPSGSGKSTLLNCISTIDTVTSGSILVGGKDITSMSRRQLSKFRRDDLGFIFQDSNLLNTLTGFENISLALSIKGVSARKIPAMVNQISTRLGVDGVLSKFPYQMSGGQRQRIAAARAIVGDPKIILADEPTGALDSRSATILLEIMEMLNQQMSATILMVTHDAFAASYTNRVLFIKDGSVFNELLRGDESRDRFFARIMEVVSFLGGEAGHVS